MPTYNGEYYSGYGQPSANVIAGMVAADKAAAAKKTATATAPAPQSSGGGGSKTAVANAPDYNLQNDPSKYVNANGVTYASADVARQQGVSDFLAGSAPKAPTTVPPKAVYTADPAATDLANKQNDLATATNAMALQQQQQAQATQQVQPAATVADLEKIAKQDEGNAQINAIAEKQEAAYQNFQSQLSQLQAGTFPLTPDQQAQVNATQSQFNVLKAQQDIANKNYEAGVKLAGIAAGRNRYAPEIELGNIQNAVSAGLQKVAELDTKAALAIADLRAGFQSQNFELINAAYTAASNYFAQKTDTIFKMSENVRQETQLALNLHQQQVAEQQAEMAREDAARKFASENNITKPFYLVGNTAINTQTGEAVDLPTYQRLTGQQVGLPESQTDFSKIQHIDLPERAQVAAIMDKYPDAGITLNDSLDTATSKLRGSAIYRKETYIAPLAGAGGTGYKYVDVGNVQDPNSANPAWGGLSLNGLTNAAKLYLAQNGKMPSLGLGSAQATQAKRDAIINYAGQIADSLGMDINQISTLYKANSKAAGTIIDRVAKIDTTSAALVAQFPRLAALATKVSDLGITESDVTAGKALVARKFGSVDAGNYVELIQTVRGDYAALQASLAGSRGGQYFAQNAKDAIPLGLTPEQYLGLADTISTSALNARIATSDEAQSLIGQIGNPGANNTNQTLDLNGVKYHLGPDGLYYQE